MKARLVALLLSAIAVYTAAAQTIQFPKVDLPSVARGSKVFPIEAGEVTINGTLLKRVEIGRSTAIITYFNKSSKDAQPKYRFRLIDAYGIEVATFDDQWSFQTVPSGEAKKESKSFYPVRLEQTIQFTGIKLPPDWATPAYLVIEGSEL